MVRSSDRNCQSEIIQKALAMLNMIEHSNDNALVYNHVTLLLEEYCEKQVEKEQLLCSLISLVLGAFSIHLDSESTLYTQIKLLQFRLASPITNTELVALQHYVESCADQITQSDLSEVQVIKQTLHSLIHSFGLDNDKAFGGVNKTTPDKESPLQSGSVIKQVDDVTQAAIKSFRKSLQEFLTTNSLANCIEQNEKFSVLLEVELAAMKHLNDQVSFEERKNTLLSELDKILHSHQQMASYLHNMSEFLFALDKDSMQLTEELDRLTFLSLTDELTGLPNRRAFIQRLQDEMARIKRYGHELSIAFLDLDHFKQINDQYGHSAGDKVLKSYSDTILSTFRQQDMVARYGGEEFVVIFTNTDHNGALQALKKAQKRVAALQLELNGEFVSLPTFSAGLVEYHGETNIDTLIHRADTILYDAKNKGRNRIEVESSESVPE